MKSTKTACLDTVAVESNHRHNGVEPLLDTLGEEGPAYHFQRRSLTAVTALQPADQLPPGESTVLRQLPRCELQQAASSSQQQSSVLLCMAKKQEKFVRTLALPCLPSW